MLLKAVLHPFACNSYWLWNIFRFLRFARWSTTFLQTPNHLRYVAMLALTQLSNYLNLKGSFSAVSKQNFASKYSLESSRRDLQDLHAFAPLRPQYFSKSSSIFGAFSKLHILKSSIFFKFRRDFHWFSWNLLGFSQISLKNTATIRNFSSSI